MQGPGTRSKCVCVGGSQHSWTPQPREGVRVRVMGSEGPGVKGGSGKQLGRRGQRASEEMGCGCGRPARTDVFRRRRRQTLVVSYLGVPEEEGQALLSARLVLLKTFFSKTICSFMEGNVSS